MVDWALSELFQKVTFEEVNNTDKSIVLKGTSDVGTVYLKTVNENARFEASLTAFIADEFPRITVDLLVVDTVNNWMLMRERFPGSHCGIIKQRKPTHHLSVVMQIFSNRRFRLLNIFCL